MGQVSKKQGSRRGLSRREFLTRSAMASTMAAASPYIIPASALGADGNTAPSNRIVMGCIGVGSQGTSNLKWFLGNNDTQFVAVCDVDRAHRENAQQIINETYGNSDCKGYNDFRELLERDDLDALSIAVPDHWHAIPAIAGAKKGLDMYAEKPLSLTIPDGIAMVEAVEGSKVVWQTGSWQRSKAHFRFACEIVRSGRIGKVHTVEVGLPTGSPIEPQPAMPIPEGFDYDRWLGPAPEAPYTEKRCHWNFRWILDYSGGQLTDWGAHHCDIANWGMDTEGTGPIWVEGVGAFPREGLWTAATDYHFTARYGKNQSSVSPNGFEMKVANTATYPMGAKFIGEKGWVHVSRKGLETGPDSLKSTVIGDKDVQLYDSKDHVRNFLECVRSRQETITPIRVAHRAISIAHLGNIAMRMGRAIQWDPVAQRLVDDPAAERLFDRAKRGQWHL